MISLFFPRLQVAFLTVLGHGGLLACGGQKDDSDTHIIIKTLTGYVQVLQRERSEDEREVLLFQKSILHFVISAVSSRRNTLWYGPLELKNFKILKFKLEA